MRKWRKPLAVILTWTMCLSLLSVTAFADTVEAGTRQSFEETVDEEVKDDGLDQDFQEEDNRGAEADEANQGSQEEEKEGAGAGEASLDSEGAGSEGAEAGEANQASQEEDKEGDGAGEASSDSEGAGSEGAGAGEANQDSQEEDSEGAGAGDVDTDLEGTDSEKAEDNEAGQDGAAGQNTENILAWNILRINVESGQDDNSTAESAETPAGWYIQDDVLMYEGKPADTQGWAVNEKNEIVDKNGSVINFDGQITYQVNSQTKDGKTEYTVNFEGLKYEKQDTTSHQWFPNEPNITPDDLDDRTPLEVTASCGKVDGKDVLLDEDGKPLDMSDWYVNDEGVLMCSGREILFKGVTYQASAVTDATERTTGYNITFSYKKAPTSGTMTWNVENNKLVCNGAPVDLDNANIELSQGMTKDQFKDILDSKQLVSIEKVDDSSYKVTYKDPHEDTLKSSNEGLILFNGEVYYVTEDGSTHSVKDSEKGLPDGYILEKNYMGKWSVKNAEGKVFCDTIVSVSNDHKEYTTNGHVPYTYTLPSQVDWLKWMNDWSKMKPGDGMKLSNQPEDNSTPDPIQFDPKTGRPLLDDKGQFVPVPKEAHEAGDGGSAGCNTLLDPSISAVRVYEYNNQRYFCYVTITANWDLDINDNPSDSPEDTKSVTFKVTNSPSEEETYNAVFNLGEYKDVVTGYEWVPVGNGMYQLTYFVEGNPDPIVTPIVTPTPPEDTPDPETPTEDGEEEVPEVPTESGEEEVPEDPTESNGEKVPGTEQPERVPREETAESNESHREENPTADITEEVLLTEITENEVPLAERVGEEEIITEIDENKVPLADVPRTGDSSMAWIVLALSSGLSLIWLALTGKKREELAE